MVYVGIDVAKDKHDCFIANSDGEILYDVFTIQNDMDGFEDLLFKIKTASRELSKVVFLSIIFTIMEILPPLSLTI